MPRLYKRVSNQFPSMFPKAKDYRVSNPKPKIGSDTSSPIKKPTCGKCGKKHYDDFLKERLLFCLWKKWAQGSRFPKFEGVRKGEW